MSRKERIIEAVMGLSPEDKAVVVASINALLGRDPVASLLRQRLDAGELDLAEYRRLVLEHMDSQ